MSTVLTSVATAVAVGAAVSEVRRWGAFHREEVHSRVTGLRAGVEIAWRLFEAQAEMWTEMRERQRG